MGFWMELGLSGFRVDAVPFLLETKRQQDKRRRCPTRTTTWPTCARSCAGATGRRCCSARSTCPTPTLMPFFGARDGGGSTDELTMCFDFIGMQAMYLSLARGDAEPLADALRAAPGRRPRTGTGPRSCATTTS